MPRQPDHPALHRSDLRRPALGAGSVLDELAGQAPTDDPWEWAARAFDPVPSTETPWRDIARPEQLPPGGRWLTWLFLAGRGAGKTRSCAEAIKEQALRFPGLRAALVAPTYADGRDVMVEGESGLLAVLPERELLGRSRDTAWNRSLGELRLANGSQFKIHSSERPARLRGPQYHVAWGDEIAQWQDAHKGTAKDTTWSNLLFCLRLPPLPGWPGGFASRIFASTTPRPVELLTVRPTILAREPERAGLLQRSNTVVTRGKTSDNLANLNAVYKANVVDPLVGTRLGRQELDAELIDEVEGAWLTQAAIDKGRRRIGEIPHLVARVVAVDPAATAADTSDDTGIMVVGADNAGDGYVLDDRSEHAKPDVWGRAVWETVIDHQADAIVVEDNQGGDMVEHVLVTTWEALQRERARRGLPMPRVPIVRVHPTAGQGKWVRALTLQPMYDQGRIHHVIDPGLRGTDALTAYEDQGLTWTGAKEEASPDRVDAAVHGLTWLLHPGQRVDRKTRRPVETGGRWVSPSGRR